MGEQVAAGFKWGYSSVGRAPALQAGGQGFESLYLHGRGGPGSYKAERKESSKENSDTEMGL